MTKKSQARLARDAERRHQTPTLKQLDDVHKKGGIAKNTGWDDLVALHADCFRLLNSHGDIGAYARNPNLMRHIEDQALLASNIAQLASDIKKLASELKEIGAQHTGKTGGTTTPDELIQNITIYEQYNLFMERHGAVVMPTVLHIVEQFERAEHLYLRELKAAAEANALTDPAVVSDVVPKEHTEVADAASTTSEATASTQE